MELKRHPFDLVNPVEDFRDLWHRTARIAFHLFAELRTFKILSGTQQVWLPDCAAASRAGTSGAAKAVSTGDDFAIRNRSGV